MNKITFWKIKPGKRQIWEMWCKEIIARKEEALITIAEEDLVRERCTIIGEGDSSFVVYHHISLEDKEKKPMNMDREINQKHKKIFDECLESASITPGYDLKVGS